MTWPECWELLDWTGRQWRSDKRGAIPRELAPILERLQLGEAGWWRLLSAFGRRFRRAAGRPEALEREARARGVRWLQGIAASRAAFAAVVGQPA
jgi:hypothetical protein